MIISILRLLTTISEIRLGSISFFVLLFQAEAAEIQEGQSVRAYLYVLFHKGKGLRDYDTRKSIYSHYSE